VAARPPRDRFTISVYADPETLRSRFAGDVRTGLTAERKRLPCWYFYDDEGSRLFEMISRLPEYYLTRAEREILQDHAGDLAARFREAPVLIELGSGSAVKTRIVIDALLHRHDALRYMPIDISRGALEESAAALLRDYPALEIHAVAGEYHEGLHRLDAPAGGPKLILWLGSSVGNLDRPDAAAFLRRIRDVMLSHDRLLAGIDLRKHHAVLEAAYDDAQGITARFNLNLLARINRELGGRFDLQAFRHRAVYDEDAGRVEMYLDSAREQSVRIAALELTVPFAAGEGIHTENSYKYSVEEIEALASEARLRIDGQWLDAGRQFSVNVFAPT
jgi:dimethylhistidine N-methyltransferase